MATTFRGRSVFLADRRFFAISAIVMALLNVAGFSFFAAMGFSSFRSPVSVHIHAVLFMGWVALFVMQASLAATGSLALHRRLLLVKRKPSSPLSSLTAARTRSTRLKKFARSPVSA